MKVRITEQHLRIRVSPPDMDQLGKQQGIAAALNWAGQSLVFRLSLYEGMEPEVQFRRQCLHIKLPGTTAMEWLNSEQIGLAYKLPNSEREEATLLVEKDLPCAHRDEQAPHPPYLKFGGFE